MENRERYGGALHILELNGVMRDDSRWIRWEDTSKRKSAKTAVSYMSQVLYSK